MTDEIVHTYDGPSVPEETEEIKEKLTHAALVTRAVRWLTHTRKCALVLWERTAYYAVEIPDAIGWEASGWSVMVECKSSRSDFLKDKRKSHRNKPVGMGQEKWYFGPPGIIGVDELPEGWGLLELHDNKVKRIHTPADIKDLGSMSPRKRARHTNASISAKETPLLVAALRRSTQTMRDIQQYEVRGVSVPAETRRHRKPRHVRRT